MAVYDFINRDTGEITERVMSMSEYDKFMADNPHLERYYGNQVINFYEAAPKIDGGFKEVLNRIKSHHHESTIQV